MSDTQGSYDNLAPLAEASALLHTLPQVERQALIAEYERLAGCRLVVMIGQIALDSVTYLEDVIHDVSRGQDMHLMLASPGGNGEAALRMARSLQYRCRELTVIVPTEAKSAATLLALGAHHIIMAPFSDLGPVDPQLWDGENLLSAKAIIAAVDDAVKNVLAEPATVPIYDRLLSNLDAIMLQEARAGLGSSYTLLRAVLSANPDRTSEEVERLRIRLEQDLIDSPQSHSEVYGPDRAISAGLPVIEANLYSEEWRLLWRLWARYFALGAYRIFEGRSASLIVGRPPDA